MTKITADHLARGAFVYVRQSTADQLVHNQESLRRQYGLAGRAKVAEAQRMAREWKRAGRGCRSSRRRNCFMQGRCSHDRFHVEAPNAICHGASNR